MAEDTFTMEITNQAAFNAALAQIHTDLDDLKGPLAACGRELATRAGNAAPRASGRLAGSHRALPAGPRSVRVVADTPYAAPIHWGWPAHGIRRRPWAVATWERDPAPRDRLAEGIQADLDKAAART